MSNHLSFVGLRHLMISLIFLLMHLSSNLNAQSDDSAPEDDEQLFLALPKHRPVHVIQRKLFIKGLRLEFAPRGGGIFNDPFITTLTYGGDLVFHINEWLAIGGHYLRTYTQDTLNTKVLRDDYELEADRSEIKQLTMGEFYWTPIYNKASLMGRAVLHYDFYFTLGAGMAWTMLHRNINKSDEEIAAETEAADPGTPVFGTKPLSEDKTNVIMNIGVGARIFLTKWLVVRFDIKDMIYRAGVGGTDTDDSAKMAFVHRIPITIGLGFFFPGRE